MRLSHPLKDTLAALTGTECVDSCLRSLAVTFLTNAIYVTAIRGVTFTRKPRAMGQIFSHCPGLLFVKRPRFDSYYYYQYKEERASLLSLLLSLHMYVCVNG